MFVDREQGSRHQYRADYQRVDQNAERYGGADLGDVDLRDPRQGGERSREHDARGGDHAAVSSRPTRGGVRQAPRVKVESPYRAVALGLLGLP